MRTLKLFCLALTIAAIMGGVPLKVNSATAVEARWEYAASSDIQWLDNWQDGLSTADLNGDRIPDVVFGTSSGTVVALDGRTGKELWEPVSVPNAVGNVSADIMLLHGFGGVRDVVAGGKSRSGEATIVVIHNDGTLDWRFVGEYQEVTDFACGDVDGDGDFDVAAAMGTYPWGGGQVVILDGRTGKEIWNVSLGKGIAFAIDVRDIDRDGDAEVAVTTYDNKVYLIDGRTNEILWERTGAWYGRDVIIEDVDDDGEFEIVAGMSSPYCYESNGELKWSFQSGDHFKANDVNGDRRTEIVVSDPFPGKTYVLNGDTGSELWSRDGGISDTGDVNGDGVADVVIASLKHWDPDLSIQNVVAVDGANNLLWQYDLDAEPSAVVVANVDADMDNEILVAVGNTLTVLDTYAKPDEEPDNRDRIILDAGVLNDMQIDPSDPVITVSSGDRISGNLDITVYNSHGGDFRPISQVFSVGATPTWGDRETDYWTIAWNTPAGNTNHTVAINLTAPSSAGTYYIIMASSLWVGSGDFMPNIMSCSAIWHFGGKWYDGNDVVDWDAETIQNAIDYGYVTVPWLMERDYEDVDIGAAAVKVIVSGEEPDSHIITAKAMDNGVISPAGEVTVLHGAKQTFIIKPEPCYRIADVVIDNDPIGAVTEYTFTDVVSDHTIQATFAIDTALIIAKAGNNGSISPSGEVAVKCGTDQTFNITPDTGYSVADVLVDGQSVGAVTTYSFTNITSDHIIEARFAMGSYVITATAGDGGAISPSGEVEVAHGARQTFTIKPDPCYRIADVLVDNEPVDAMTEYTFADVTSDHTIQVTFAIDTTIIIAKAGNNGSISPSGEVVVKCGTDQTFVITPDRGYSIADVLVDGQSVGAVKTYRFTDITSEHTIEARFTMDIYTIAATAGDGGAISPSGELGVASGAKQTFIIRPDPCYHVADVFVDNEPIDIVTEYIFTDITYDHTIQATFAVDEYTITAKAGANGTISPSGEVEVKCGADQRFMITPDEGYHVSDVLVNGDSVGAVTAYSFDNVTSQGTIEAIFGVSDIEPPAGSITINGNAQYTSDRVVTLELSAEDDSGVVSEMRFRNDNVNYSDWEAYTTVREWQLSDGDGLKTVYAQFADTAGNQSTARISDSITLDTVLPTTVSATPTSDAENIPINAAITMVFSEEIDESSISISVSGSVSGDVSGDISYSDLTLTFVPDGIFSDNEGITVEITAADLAANGIVYSVQFSTGIGIWPGDTNRDGGVDILDILPIGKYWQEEGQPRAPADISWEIQPAIPWENEEVTHADADGNGIVDEKDLNALAQNWKLTHSTGGVVDNSENTVPMSLQQYLDVSGTAPPDIEQLRTYLWMLIDPAETKFIPVHASLGQNYPNPSNPETWIPYQLAADADVVISIYDSAGRLTRRLDMGHRQAGFYLDKDDAAYWDGRNSRGEIAASGIYFYQFNAGDFRATRKLLIIK